MDTEKKSRMWLPRLLFGLVLLLTLTLFSAAYLNPVTEQLMCPIGYQPRVYTFDLSLFTNPKLRVKDGVTYTNEKYAFFVEMAAIEPENYENWPGWYDGHRQWRKENALSLWGGSTVKYTSCGAVGMLVPRERGGFEVVQVAHRTHDSCQLLGISERSLDLPSLVSWSWFYPTQFYDDDVQVEGNIRLHGEYYDLLYSHQQNNYAFSKNPPRIPSTKQYPVLVCQSDKEIELRLIAERRGWLHGVTPEVILYQTTYHLGDEVGVVVPTVTTPVEEEYFWSLPTKKIETIEDAVKVVAYIFVPKLPSLSIISNGIAGAIGNITAAPASPVSWVESILILGWTFIYFISMFMFHFVKTYLFLSVTYLLWIEILFQFSVISGRGALPIVGIAYVSGFLMITGSFAFLLVDWSGWWI